MFCYHVQGTPEELAAYRAAQGQYYIEESEGKYAGTPILNRPQRYPAGTPLIITRDGRVAIPKRRSDVDLEQIHKRAKSFNDEHIAKAAAEHIVSLIVKEELGTGAVGTTVAPAAATNVADAISEATALPPVATESRKEDEYEVIENDDLSLDKG
jgi:hypothetical protein